MKKLIKTFLMLFCILSYCPIYGIEEGIYRIGATYHTQSCGRPPWGASGYFFLQALDNDEVRMSLFFCGEEIESEPEILRSFSDYLWSIEPQKDEGYKICSNAEAGIRCLEMTRSEKLKFTSVKLSRPSLLEDQLWSIQPMEDGYAICSKNPYLQYRCLNGIEVGGYPQIFWQLTKTDYKLNGLEKFDKQQDIRIDSLDSSNQQQDIRLEALEEKLRELTRTDELQANDLSSFGNRLRSLEQLNEQVNIFRSSFVSGATYSLIPEVIKDAIEFSGYSKKAANVAAMVAQGAMVSYNTIDPLTPSSYASTITGIAARYGFSYLGFSNDASAIAGSTAAVVTTLLLNPEEASVDYLTRCSIALAGSYAGSTLLLKAKSWIYEFWHNEKISSLTAQASSWAFERISSYGFWNKSRKIT
jgi:hypothetical protein